MHENESLADAGQTLLRAALLGIAIVVTGMLLARWQRATSPQRRLLAPVLWCGAATIAALGLSLAGQLANLPDDVLNVFDFAGLFIFASVPIAFISGIVRQNLSSGQSVGRLVARLGDGPGRGPNRLRDALASALRDRSLAIAYWLPASGPARAAGEGRYVDANGAPVALPDAGSGRSFTLVEHDGRRVAALIHDASLDEDPELVRAAGAAAALTLENERLDAELRVQIAEVRASRARLLEVVTRERRRIERDLHDGAQQRLVALALTLGIAENQVEADPEQARALIREARDEARLALEELRELARGIHPAILDRPRPRAGAGGARQPRAAAGRAEHGAAGAAAGAGRGRRLLRRRGSARERRQIRRRDPRRGQRAAARRPRDRAGQRRRRRRRRPGRRHRPARPRGPALRDRRPSGSLQPVRPRHDHPGGDPLLDLIDTQSSGATAPCAS